MSAFTAYQNRFSPNVYVIPHDLEKVIELCESPSIVWVCRHFEAGSHQEAEHLGHQLRRSGHGEITFAGQQLGCELGGAK